MNQISSLRICLSILFLFIINGCKEEPVVNVESFDGFNISFDNKGEGQTTIILIHGWANNRTIWDAQTTHFSEKYHVIAADLPGFGKSGNNRKMWTMESYGKDIAAIIEKLELSKVVLAGFSLGAPVAIETAIKAREQVVGVVLVDNLQDVEMKFAPPMIQYMDSMMMDMVNKPTMEKLVQGGFFKHNIDSSYHRVLKLWKDVPQIGWSESLIELLKWQNEQSVNSIKSVEAPIIAINSDMQPTKVDVFRKYAPTFKAKIVKDVGHVIMWDNEKEFNRLLEESIQEFIQN
ncbi:MAG: alpha/beta hydrolase [Maribacter sp.]|nr:alpha/beta hydrolase [Maribacter sp.]